MAQRKVEVHPGEAKLIAMYLDEREQLLQKLTGAVTLVCTRERIPVAGLLGVDGNELILDVPDAEQPDRMESPTPGAGVVGVISGAPSAESGSESTPAANSNGLEPVTEAPDVGIPARGAFRHTEGG
jgi:hypothetical protein